ncbi:hypothetical protein AB0I94_18145 [Streptomyces sp. NPDC050147]|uniref:hypothetical protein n=1 Tax=Streptomyces sp. NPDC050147 TaxID=3155513 RepID=UPI0034202A63
MSSRVRASWCPLLGVLLVVLGGFCGPVASTAAASTAAPSTASAEQPRAATAFVHEADSVPGCGKGGQRDNGGRPMSPPRPSSAHELLPALYEAHAATGSWGADQAVLSVSPGRAPPALVPPSPIELSVLRV